MENLKFINDVLKPWEDFNQILSQPFAVQPELSSFTHIVNTLSVSISHYNEDKYLKRRKLKSLMNDIADTAKHIVLDKPERETVTAISSCFLCNDQGQFLFLRNIPFIYYKKYPDIKYDFMKASLLEIQEIMKEEKIDIGRKIPILEFQDPIYRKVAQLKFNPQYCIKMESINIKFFKEGDNKELIPYDPPKVNFKLY